MLKIGHRGASGALPENTLSAFRGALAAGADGVELDVHLLKSGELAVIHDDTVDRTTDGNGCVADMTFEQMRALRTRSDAPVPMLGEVLDALGGAYCFIEVKYENAADRAAEHIAHAIGQGYPADRLWLISFRHEALSIAHARFPALQTGASFSELTSTSVRETHLLGAKAIIPHHQSFNSSHIRQAHALGLKVICWTVNEPSDIARLTAMGVDGIMSDYPERLMVKRRE